MEIGKEIKPSKEIWHYYNRNEINQSGITIGLIIAAIADVIAGYDISYSSSELLKDLGYIKINKRKKTVTKKGMLVLAHELHERYHRGLEMYHKIVNPNNIS